MTNKELRIGLTMRVIETEGYQETRDAIAHDWALFLKKALPGVKWLLIPNILDDIVSYSRAWDLKGFIFTGGNDLLACHKRDHTELKLLDYATAENLPVLGICRGMQLICHHYGWSVKACPDPKVHVAREHLVKIVENPFTGNTDSIMVNSYHDNCVRQPVNTDKQALTAFAFSEDGLTEGVYIVGKNIAGVMWHPERNSKVSSFDQAIIDYIFKNRKER